MVPPQQGKMNFSPQGEKLGLSPAQLHKWAQEDSVKSCPTRREMGSMEFLRWCRVAWADGAINCRPRATV